MGNGVVRNLPHRAAPKKLSIFRQQPNLGIFRLGQRARAAVVAFDLVTIHPNPGPTCRDRTEEGRRRKRERRYIRRKEKAEVKTKICQQCNTEPVQEQIMV